MGREGVMRRRALPPEDKESQRRPRCSPLRLPLQDRQLLFFLSRSIHFSLQDAENPGLQAPSSPWNQGQPVFSTSRIAWPCPWAAEFENSVEGDPEASPKAATAHPDLLSCTPGPLGQAVGVSRGKCYREGRVAPETGSLCSTGLSCGRVKVQSENPQEAPWVVPGSAAQGGVRPGGWGK